MLEKSDAEYTGDHDDDTEESFFDAGGNSLAAMRFVGRVRARYGAVLAIRDLYETPAFRAIAGRLSENVADAGPEQGGAGAAPGAAMSDEERRLLGLG